MKTLLNALLSCSAAFLLVGCSSCGKQANSGAPKKVVAQKTQKCQKKGQKKSAPAATTKVAYNAVPSDELPSDDELNHLAFLNENFLVEDYDTHLDAANNAVESLSPEEKDALNEEINHLVSLWKTDESDLRVDFKTLYLDSNTPVIDTTEQKPEHTVAENEMSGDDVLRSEVPLITAFDEAQEMTKDIEAETTKDISPEALTA